MSKPLVTISRRSAIVITALSLVSVIVGASVVSNYLLPSHVVITTLPGIHASFCDPGTQAILGPATTFDFGDVQQGQNKGGLFVSVANDQGSATQWLISDGTADASGTTTESLQTQALPAFTTLTWNMLALMGSPIALQPGQRTQCISITLSVSTSATGGDYSFTIEFVTYSSASG